MTPFLALFIAAAAPTAIIDTAAGVPGLEPLALLAPGTELVVGDGRVRLAYFASCVHETVHGGRLRVGVTASITDGATVERVTADCTPPARYAPGRAGALVLRGAGAPTPTTTRRVRTRTPILVDARGGHTPAGPLRPGTVYRVCTARGCVRLWVDPRAQHDHGPVLERVVPLP